MKESEGMLRSLILTSLLVLAGHLGTVGTASADTFAISSVFRNFCCTDWTDKDDPTSPVPNPGGGAPAFLGGWVIQPGLTSRTVEQTLVGSTGPFQLTIPVGRISAMTGPNFVPAHPNPLFDSITLSFDGANELGVMQGGGGPGDMVFCPEAVGPQPFSVSPCTVPGDATGVLPYNGRIRVTPTPGGNQFGGSMAMLGSGSVGVLNAHNAAGTVWTELHFALPFSIVGNGSAANPVEQGSIPGSNVFYSTPNKSLPPTGTLTTPGGATGHMWTTGMVTVSITKQNNPLAPTQIVTLTGNDSRVLTGPDKGTGNVTFVSGNLYQNLTTGNPQVRGNILSINLPEPGMAMAIGAGALGLVLAGAGRKRR